MDGLGQSFVFVQDLKELNRIHFREESVAVALKIRHHLLDLVQAIGYRRFLFRGKEF
jgi:hypothetical protein